MIQVYAGERFLLPIELFSEIILVVQGGGARGGPFLPERYWIEQSEF